MSKRKPKGFEDKAAHPAQDKTHDTLAAAAHEVLDLVLIQIAPGREIKGVGTAGQVVSVDRESADRYVADGYASYYTKELNDGQ